MVEDDVRGGRRQGVVLRLGLTHKVHPRHSVYRWSWFSALNKFLLEDYVDCFIKSIQSQ